MQVLLVNPWLSLDTARENGSMIYGNYHTTAVTRGLFRPLVCGSSEKGAGWPARPSCLQISRY